MKKSDQVSERPDQQWMESLVKDNLIGAWVDHGVSSLTARAAGNPLDFSGFKSTDLMIPDF